MKKHLTKFQTNENQNLRESKINLIDIMYMGYALFIIVFSYI